MATFRYVGEKQLQFDEAHDDFYLVFVMGDEYVAHLVGDKYFVYHESEPTLKFTLTKKEAKALLADSEEILDVEVDPDNPPYLMFEPKFENVSKLYDYYNKLLFKNKCPVVKYVKTNKANTYGLAEARMVRGKYVYTMRINEAVMVDRKFFTDALIHEMIHLRNYALGYEKVMAGDEDGHFDIHASHGPRLLSEMNRINKQGYNLTTVVHDDHYKQKTTGTFYAIVGYVGNTANVRTHGASHMVGWFKPRGVISSELFNKACDKLADDFPQY